MVVDALRVVYEEELGEGPVADEFARAHGRLWRRLFDGDPDAAGLLEIEEALDHIGLGLDVLHRANAAVASELGDIVALRFRKSLRARHDYAAALAETLDRMDDLGRAARLA
jgi:hypothetical protein